MRGIVLSLAAVSGLGAALVGGRAIATGGSGPAQPATAAATRAVPERDAGPIYFGGRLAPIVVVATVPARETARKAQECERAPS
jgi:hypothetical protein